MIFKKRKGVDSVISLYGERIIGHTKEMTVGAELNDWVPKTPGNMGWGDNG